MIAKCINCSYFTPPISHCPPEYIILDPKEIVGGLCWWNMKAVLADNNCREFKPKELKVQGDNE